MKLNTIEAVLDEVSAGTDFSFTTKIKTDGTLYLIMQGDNPAGEDWCTEIELNVPKTKKEFIEALYSKIDSYYQDYDVEEEVQMWLEAKRSGTSGIPGVKALVDNGEYKENALKEFSEKLYNLF